jgi:argininosuccinate lyase
MPQTKQSTWGGRFDEAPAELLRDFTESVSFDKRLAPHDIRGSIAHARMLQKIGLLTRAEFQSIQKNLQSIAKEIISGKFSWDTALEDVHMNIEAELTRRTPAGAKLHTGRSRNDQVATSLKLWLLDDIRQTQNHIRLLQKSLLTWAERDGFTLLPGYTHLQRAQPILLAHHLLAYIEMLERDHQRFSDTAKRAKKCPLGSGALAGSTLPLNRELTAKTLGFADDRGRPLLATNSLDAVSDRDHIVEYLSAAALCGVHLSRLAEDLIIWSTAEFSFIRIGDAYTTGSSLMPQKKNPDIAELARGKAGRLVGNLVNLLVTLKALPLSYNRDLQEDKPPLFDTSDTLHATLRVLAAMLDNTSVLREKCTNAASDPLLLATDVADELVMLGVPFRQAHHIVGEAVAFSEKNNISLFHIPAEQAQKIHPKLSTALARANQPPIQQLTKRKMPGAPHPALIKKQLSHWRKKIAQNAAG